MALTISSIGSSGGFFGRTSLSFALLMQGCGQANDLVSVGQIVLEMKSRSELYIDRTAYTAIVDALLKCGSDKGMLSFNSGYLKLLGDSCRNKR